MGTDPRQLEFGFALWTREMVRELIRREFGVGLSVVSAGRLLHDSPGPVYLIVDGHPLHRAALVKKHVASTGGLLKLFCLPGYSPELNPDEKSVLWGNALLLSGQIAH